MRYVVGLGANLGDRVGNLCEAIERLGARSDVRVLARSRLYETEALVLPGDDRQPRYLNAALVAVSALEPEAMLARCLDVELGMGRRRRRRWEARVIDLDLLVAVGDDGVVRAHQSDALRLPHPGFFERAFQLVPALEVAPWLPSAWQATAERLGPCGRVFDDPRW